MGRRINKQNTKWSKRQSESPAFDELEWYVLVTNPTKSAKAAENLYLAGYSVYLPKQQFEVIHHRTKKVIIKTVDLFKQYLFVGLPKVGGDWFTLRACEGVAHALGTDAPLSLPPAVVRDLWVNEHDLKFDDTKEAKIRRKEIARTERGTAKLRFKGAASAKFKINEVPFIGRIKDFNAKGELVALVEMLGQEVTVTVPSKDAEPISCQDLDTSGKAA